MLSAWGIRIIQIFYGFKNDIAPELVGGLDNIRIIPWDENWEKAQRIIPEAKILLEKWGIV